MAVRTDFSCGGIATDGEGRVVVIATRNLKGERVWGLPKGHPARGEGPLAAALREVEEETGLQVSAVGSEPAGEIDYWFVTGGVRVHKRVAYYRMEVTGGDGARHDAEVEEVALLPLEQARKRLSYRNESTLLQEVLCG
ncbi:MAG: NUDIX domain-containing protein [Actinomycetota bacterium]|nr:NUDIX domain-containing protein [Actinomycetota bacterium]